MKGLILSIVLCIGVMSYGQNIKRIVDKNDTIALQKYINSAEGFVDMILTRVSNSELVELHPFVYAVSRGNLNLAKIFVKNRAFFIDFDRQLGLAFAISVSKNNTEIIDYLYSLNPNINEVCSFCNGHNALMITITNGNEELFFKLKEKSEFNLISNEGNNLLHLIGEDIKSYSQIIFSELKNHKDVDINLINKYNRTPLHYAARSGNEELFFELVKIGAEANNLNDLYADAITGGAVKIFEYVRQLIKVVPNWTSFPEMKEKDGNTLYALEIGIKNNNTKIVKIIFNEMFTEVKDVKQDDQIEVVTKILNSRQLENDQFWPLWEVTQVKNKELFEFLIRSMVDFNNLKLEYTAYNRFVEDDYTEIAEVYFTKFEYRSAKRRFGKIFVKNLYEELEVSF